MCNLKNWPNPGRGEHLFRLFDHCMFSLVLLGLGCVFASVPTFYPRQQTWSPVIPRPDLGHHTFPFLYRFPNQFRPRAITYQPPPISMMTQEVLKPIESPVNKVLKSLAEQQEITTAVLKRIEKTFYFSTKASMERQNQQAWTEKARIQGSAEMVNFWTNRPEDIYVAGTVPEIYLAEEVYEAALVAFEDIEGDEETESYCEPFEPKRRVTPKRKSSKALKKPIKMIEDDESESDWEPTEPKKQAAPKRKSSNVSKTPAKPSSEKASKYSGTKKTAGKAAKKPVASKKPVEKTTPKRLRSSGRDNRPQKKQRTEEKENMVPRVTRSKNQQRK